MGAYGSSRDDKNAKFKNPEFLNFGKTDVEKTTKKKFIYESIFNQNNYSDAKYKIYDSFLQSGAEESRVTIKIVEFEENGLLYQFCFNPNENEEYRLTEEYVRLVE